MGFRDVCKSRLKAGEALICTLDTMLYYISWLRLLNLAVRILQYVWPAKIELPLIYIYLINLVLLVRTVQYGS